MAGVIAEATDARTALWFSAIGGMVDRSSSGSRPCANSSEFRGRNPDAWCSGPW